MDFPIENVAPVASAVVPVVPRRVIRSPDGGLVLVTADNGPFVILDRALRRVRQGALDIEGPAAVTDDGGIAVAAVDRLVMFDANGRRAFELPHRIWALGANRKPVSLGDVLALPSGELLAALPFGREGAEVALLTRFGEVRARAEVPIEPEVSLMFDETPRPGTVALWGADGPDREWTFLIHVAGSTLEVVPVAGLQCNDHGPPTFRPDGREALIQTTTELLRCEWVGDELRKVDAIPADGDLGFAETPAYFGEGRCVVTDVGSARLFVITLDGSRPLHELVVAGHEPMTFQELFPGARDEPDPVTDLSYLRPWSDGRVLTVHRRQDKHTLTLLEPPRGRRK